MAFSPTLRSVSRYRFRLIGGYFKRSSTVSNASGKARGNWRHRSTKNSSGCGALMPQGWSAAIVHVFKDLPEEVGDRRRQLHALFPACVRATTSSPIRAQRGPLWMKASRPGRKPQAGIAHQRILLSLPGRTMAYRHSR